MATTTKKANTAPASEEVEAEEEEAAAAAAAAGDPDTGTEEEETDEASSGDGVEDDPDAEEETVDEELFAQLPVLPKATYEMELTKMAARTMEADDREGYRSGIEYTFEPDRSEYPEAPKVKITVWGHLYDDDKPGMKDMNRRDVIAFRKAGLFPEPVILSGKPGTAKKIKWDYDEQVGGMFSVKLDVEEYNEEKRNRIKAVKAI